MLSTDLWTRATQFFFIYPCEIPPEDSSPLLSFHPLLCMPAMMTILFLHSHPISTPVKVFHLYNASGTWKGKVNICGTCFSIAPFGLKSVMSFLSRWVESVKLGNDEISILDKGKKMGSGNHFLHGVYIQSHCWSLDGVQSRPGVMGIHTPWPDTPGTELVTDEDMRIDSFWPTQTVFAFYRICISLQ